MLSGNAQLTTNHNDTGNRFEARGRVREEATFLCKNIQIRAAGAHSVYPVLWRPSQPNGRYLDTIENMYSSILLR